MGRRARRRAGARHGAAAAAAALLVARAGGAAGPLCHEKFRALEGCIGNDYDRLNAQCAEVYAKLRSCLDRDWKTIDDAGGYDRPAGAFNRMRRCRHGVMLFNPMDWYIGRGLEVYGEWGERKVDIWRRIVKPGHVAIDVGAHVGALTLPLSALVGREGRVVAIEPFYPSFATLAANVGLNSLQNVELRQAVLADRAGRVFLSRSSLAFSVHDFFNFGSMNFNTLRVYNATDDVERPSSAWDEYQVMPLDQMSLARLDFVKIDAEQMELSVLVGAQRMIKKFKPVLFIEYRSPWEKETSVLDFLRQKLRYECVLLRIPVFNMGNYRSFSEDIWGGTTKLVSFNLLCKHRWWDYADMNEEVLELFDTAVDTDIEGLRTTPTADPFEAMALSDDGKDPFAASAGSGEEEVSLDELLADEPPKQQPPSKRPPAAAGGAAPAPPPPPRREKRRHEELSLDELLAEESAPAAKRPARPARDEELSLDELLADDGAEAAAARPAPPDRQAKQREQAGQAKPAKKKERAKQKEPAKPAKPAKPKPAAPQAQARPERRADEMTLEELLEGEDKAPGPQRAPSSGAGPQRGRPQAEVESAGRRPERQPPRRAVEELSLDELLDAAEGERPRGDIPAWDAPQDEELTLDELVGGGSGKSWEDLTLDDLLGPAPPPGPPVDERWDEVTLDDLMGPAPPPPATGAGRERAQASKYEEMSLDELLGLDSEGPAPASRLPEPAPAPPPAPAAGRGKKGKKEAAKRRDDGGSAAKAEPVELRYDDELTLDEL